MPPSMLTRIEVGHLDDVSVLLRVELTAQREAQGVSMKFIFIKGSLINSKKIRESFFSNLK